jgi:LysR family nitrogen assimilation transcriptional regulator
MAREVFTAGSLGGVASREPELRELRCFHSVGRTGNFSRAARTLNVSLPTLTYQVQKLEQVIGTSLLIRHRQGVTLTPAGACLMDRLDVILNLLSSPLEQAPAPEETKGTITIGLAAEFMPLLVPPLLEECQRRWPKATLTIREGATASLEEWVLDRRVDVAVLQDPAAMAELNVEAIVTDRLGLVSCAEAGTHDRLGPIRVRQLADLKLILPDPRHWIRRRVESAAFRRGVLLDQIQQTGSLFLTIDMVRIGLGVTVLPYVVVQHEVAHGWLAFRPIEHDPLITVHAIATRATEATAPFVAEIRRLLRETMSGLARNGVWAGASEVRTSARAVGAVHDFATEAAVE